MKKILFFILTLALLLRLPLLNGSLWMDEAAQALESSRSLSEQTHIADDYQPPLFHVIIHAVLQVSHQEWWLRAPSLLAGIGTIAILYLLTEEKFSRNVAVSASFLLATSPFHIYFSQELRPYSLAALFAILSWYILLTKRGQHTRWIWYTLVTSLGLYTMYLIPFNILAQLVFVFFEKRKQLKPVVCSLIAVFFLFLPWLPSFLEQLSIGTRLTTQLPGWASAVATPQLKVLPLTFAKFVVGQYQLNGHPFALILVAIILGICGWTVIGARHDKRLRPYWYWAILSLFLAWVISFVVPVIQPKRVMFILPALFLLLAVSAEQKRWVIGLVCLTQLIFFGVYLRTPAYQRENWRSLIRVMEAEIKPDDRVLFSFPYPFAPWYWYADPKIQTISTQKIYVSRVSDVASVASQLDPVSRIYLFDYLRDLTDPNHTLEAILDQEQFTQTRVIDAQAIGFVRIFARMK